MTLLDHFRPPVEEVREWTGVHSAWMNAAADLLNQHLAPPWHAEPHLCFGFEVDVAGVIGSLPEPTVPGLVPVQFDPPPADETIPLNPLVEEFEIDVFRTSGGKELVAAIEFASPANKDRPETRAAFAAKCEALLSRGLGLCVVDVVTTASASLYAPLLHRVGVPQPPTDSLYAVSLHPREQDGELTAEVWYRPLSVGGPLPVLPLFLRDGPTVKFDLQASYDLACERSWLARDLRRLEAARQTAVA